MPNDFNPNSPEVLGLEWPVSAGGTLRVAPGIPTPGVQLRSRSAETIDQVQMAVLSNPAVTAPFTSIIEVCDAGSEIPAGQMLQAYYFPNADLSPPLPGDWRGFPGNTTTNLWSHIDDNIDFNDGLGIGSGPPNNVARFHFNSGAHPLASRIVSVDVMPYIGIGPAPAIEFREFAFRAFHVPSGIFYTPPGSNVFGNYFPLQHSIGFGELNPVTMLPWSPADIREFDGGDWAVQFESVANSACFSNIFGLMLRVNYFAAENREAVAVHVRPTSPALLEEADLYEPVAGAWSAGWSKPASGDHSICWRGCVDNLVNPNRNILASDLGWMFVQADVGPGNPGDLPEEADGQWFPPVPGMRGIENISYSGALVPNAPVQATSKRIPRIGLIRSDTAMSQDSQPYMGAHLFVGFIQVNGGQFVAQQVTPPASDDYLGFGIVAVPPTNAPDSTLTVTIHRNSDNVQMGGSFSITAAEALALSQPTVAPGARYIRGFLSSGASLVSGTQYEIRVTISNGGTWTIPAPIAYDGSNSAGAVTFGGTTDAAEGIGGAPYLTDLADYPFTIYVQPDPPRNLVVDPHEVEFPSRGFFCTVEAIDTVRVSFDEPLTAPAFVRYVVERQVADEIEETVGDWQQVSYALEVAANEWVDVEVPRGRPVRYRVRHEAAGGAFSAWVTSDWVTVNVVDAEIVLASNARPDLIAAYDRPPELRPQFLRHEDDVFIRLYGRKYQVVFGSPFDRGLAYTTPIYVNMMQDPDVRRGLPVYDQLRSITAAIGELPYVAVLDHQGNSVLAHIQVTEGEYLEPEQRYLATLTVVQVADAPTPVRFTA